MSSVILSHLADNHHSHDDFALFWFWLFPLSKSSTLGECQDLTVSFSGTTLTERL